MSIHLSLTPAAVAQLNELAGSERRKSEYLEHIIPILHRASQRAALVRLRQQAQLLEEALATELLAGDDE
jgi:hypothetical protein